MKDEGWMLHDEERRMKPCTLSEKPRSSRCEVARAAESALAVPAATAAYDGETASSSASASSKQSLANG